MYVPPGWAHQVENIFEGAEAVVGVSANFVDGAILAHAASEAAFGALLQPKIKPLAQVLAAAVDSNTTYCSDGANPWGQADVPLRV